MKIGKTDSFQTFIFCYLFTGILWSASIFAMPVESVYIENDFLLSERIDSYPWNQSLAVSSISKNWQGEPVEDLWHTQVKSVWTENYLYVLFVAGYDALSTAPEIVPDMHGDCYGIWNYDVVEMFIGDNPDIRKYYEFVASPLGQRIDIRHDKNLPKEKSFFTDYTSGWDVRVNIEKKQNRWTCQFKIPMASISSGPVAPGKEFRANFYRCTGDAEQKKDHRHYLSLNPTMASAPSFHVPERFTKLVLQKAEGSFPEPLIQIDFDGTAPGAQFPGGSKGSLGQLRQVFSAGIAGSDCADLWRTRDRTQAGPAVLEHRGVKKLNGAVSFTITGWIRRENDFSDPSYGTANQYIMNCPGRFHLFLDKWGRLACRAYTGPEKKLTQIWSSWFGSNHLNPGDRWVFFAVTFDSSKMQNNAAVYLGTERYPIHTDRVASLSAEAVSVSDQIELILGSYDRKGNGILKGMIDHVSIYASSNPRVNMALSEFQVENVRRKNLGSGWIEDIQRRETAEQQRQQQKKSSLRNRFWNDAINLHAVPVTDRVLYSVPPEPLEESTAIAVPAGQRIPLQFAASSTITGSWKIEVGRMTHSSGRPLDAKMSVYHVGHVPVESNNNGGIRTSLTSRPPERWREYQIARAPFRAAEVLIPAHDIVLRENDHQSQSYHSILLDIQVPADAHPGIYKGRVTLSSGSRSQTEDFRFAVYDVKLPEYFALQNYHWFWPEPDNLIYREPFEWWSEKHWEMLAGSMQTIRDFGQDVINIPLLDHGRYAPIRTLRKPDGNYDFDFTLFDRYFRLALQKGFKRIAGAHILWLPTSGASAVDHGRYRGIYLWHAGRKEPEILFPANYDKEKWLEFIPVFYEAMYRHLTKNGWEDNYIQQQYDEPSDPEKYRSLSELTRKYMPGIKTIDAIKTKPEFSPLVDIMVFDIHLLRADAQQLAAQRKQQGLESWFYHCASPYPPYPNRHLDDPLTSSRLYPWLGFLGNAQGYLWWACNVYRGADPYKTSIGPLPGGSQNPGHGPGDNWMYYPGPDGLRGSMRMIAFREGLVDHTLLSMLRDKNPQRAQEIAHSIAVDPVTYSTDSMDYHKGRFDLLKSLTK